MKSNMWLKLRMNKNNRHSAQNTKYFEKAADKKKEKQNKINTMIYHTEEFDKIVYIHFQVCPCLTIWKKIHVKIL